MNLILDDRQSGILDAGRSLGSTLPPDSDPSLAQAAINMARDAGMSLLTVPVEQGGGGHSFFDACLFLEGVARRRPSAAATLAAHALMTAAPLAQSVDCEGALSLLVQERIGAFGIALHADEQASGTIAAADADGYRLAGDEAFVTNGGAWALVLVAARIEGEEGPGLFVIDGDSAGVEWRARRSSLGLFGAKFSDLVLRDVRALARVDGVGEGPDLLVTMTLRNQIAAAAQAVGIGAEALDETLRAISTRKANGKSMERSGTVQAQVADMAADLDGARLLWWQAASAIDEGKPAKGLAAMAKLQAARAARSVTSGCLQLLGASSCFDDSVPARRVGDARLASVNNGSDEQMRAKTAQEFLSRLEVMGMIT